MNFEKNESKQVAVIQLRYQTLSILNSLMAVYIHSRIQNSVYKSDLLIESGVYTAGTTSVLMLGKSYNRGIRAHKLTMEAPSGCCGKPS